MGSHFREQTKSILFPSHLPVFSGLSLDIVAIWLSTVRFDSILNIGTAAMRVYNYPLPHTGKDLYCSLHTCLCFMGSHWTSYDPTKHCTFL